MQRTEKEALIQAIVLLSRKGSLFVCISLFAHKIWHFKPVNIQSVYKKSILVLHSTFSRNVQLHLSLHPQSSLA